MNDNSIVKIGLPTFNGEFAATFDFSHEISVFRCRGGEIISKEAYALVDQHPVSRSTLLRNNNVKTLICGAISNQAAVMIQHLGIKLISGISGSIEMVINDYLKGINIREKYILPGFCGMGCGRRMKNRHSNNNRCRKTHVLKRKERR